MSGIYIHIPFCKQKCYYCDFFSVANNKNREEYTNSILKELELQKDYLDNEEVQTIYFGGGTPSLLSPSELSGIMRCIYKHYKVSGNPEITFEANPDDLNDDYLKTLIRAKINRLSIGIQSFDDKDMKFLNRRHNSRQAINSINLAKEAGFQNISIDLIYGLPEMTTGSWTKNIETAFDLNIQHFSAYHLTYEEKTVLSDYLAKGKFKQAKESLSLEQFNTLINKAGKNNFIHYEISNLGKPGFFSIHNSNYWKQKKYLGIGVSAHSYNLTSRQWNIKNIEKYINSINKGIIPCETEQLDIIARYNDYIITSLRTMWGTDLNLIKTEFSDMLHNYCRSNAKKYITSKLLMMNNDILTLSDEAKFISDKIILDLIYAGT